MNLDADDPPERELYMGPRDSDVCGLDWWSDCPACREALMPAYEADNQYQLRDEVALLAWSERMERERLEYRAEPECVREMQDHLDKLWRGGRKQ